MEATEFAGSAGGEGGVLAGTSAGSFSVAIGLIDGWSAGVARGAGALFGGAGVLLATLFAGAFTFIANVHALAEDAIALHRVTA